MLSSCQVQQKRQMIGVEPVRSINYERSERMVVNDAVELFDSSFFKMLRYVHSLCPLSGCLRPAPERKQEIDQPIRTLIFCEVRFRPCFTHRALADLVIVGGKADDVDMWLALVN